MDTEPPSRKLYRRLLALGSYCAYGATGILSVSYLLRARQPFNLAKPDFTGALNSGLMGLGFVFRSFLTYAHPEQNGESKLPPYVPFIGLLVGILLLCISGVIVYANLKVLGY